MTVVPPLGGKGRQAPAPNIKLRPIPRALIFCPRDPETGEGERRGEGGNSTGETLPDFESEPQVTNITSKVSFVTTKFETNT